MKQRTESNNIVTLLFWIATLIMCIGGVNMVWGSRLFVVAYIPFVIIALMAIRLTVRDIRKCNH